MYSLFIFSFLYSNSKIEYIKNDSFLHLKVFDKLFWIHNLGIEFIIHVFYFFFFSHFFHLHTLTSIRWGPLRFHNIYELLLYSFFMKMKTLKRCFHFLYSNPTFRILKMKTEYKFLNQISFFGGGSHWKWKQKTRIVNEPSQSWATRVRLNKKLVHVCLFYK